MSEKMLTFCIVSHRQRKLVESLLNSVESFKPNINFNIIILENVASEPPINADIFDLDILYLKNDVEMSLSANINKVFAATEGKSTYFCILNPDIIFTENTLPSLIDTIHHEDVDIVSPLILDSHGVIQDSFRDVPTFKEIIFRYLGFSKTSYQLETLPEIIYPEWMGAMFILIRSKDFESLGGFNPKYELYFEDVDFCLRARKSGLKIGVVRDSTVVHNAQRTSHQKLSYLLKHIESAIRFFNSDLNKWYKNNG